MEYLVIISGKRLSSLTIGVLWYLRTTWACPRYDSYVSLFFMTSSKGLKPLALSLWNVPIEAASHRHLAYQRAYTNVLLSSLVTLGNNLNALYIIIQRDPENLSVRRCYAVHRLRR